MDCANLGSTGLKASRICLGTMTKAKATRAKQAMFLSLQVDKYPFPFHRKKVNY
jgi:aryl-alcohol dehydrogenase-like predicted oxidoreductase